MKAERSNLKLARSYTLKSVTPFVIPRTAGSVLVQTGSTANTSLIGKLEGCYRQLSRFFFFFKEIKKKKKITANFKFEQAENG